MTRREVGRVARVEQLGAVALRGEHRVERKPAQLAGEDGVERRRARDG